MMASTHKQQYQAYVSATHTVGKTQQIIMLYDGVIRLIQQGKEAIRENRIEDRYNLLTKAANIIHGMQGCLDFENGKEIATILYSFYSSIDSRLLAVHRTNNMDTCDEVIEDLRQMRDAWVAVEAAQAADNAPAAAQTAPSSEESEDAKPQGGVTLSA